MVFFLRGLTEAKMMRAMPEATMVRRLRFRRRDEEITVKTAELIATMLARPNMMIVERAMVKWWQGACSLRISYGHVHLRYCKNRELWIVRCPHH
jgi:hypothetical protein